MRLPSFVGNDLDQLERASTHSMPVSVRTINAVAKQHAAFVEQLRAPSSNDVLSNIRYTGGCVGPVDPPYNALVVRRNIVHLDSSFAHLMWKMIFPVAWAKLTYCLLPGGSSLAVEVLTERCRQVEAAPHH